MRIVEAAQLARHYPGPPAVQALREATFVVDRGEYIAIVGPSGSGKSTLLNLIGMLDTLTSGTLTLAGYPTHQLNERHRTQLRGSLIGFVFQQFHLLTDRTAEDNVALALTCRGTASRGRRDRAREALRRVGLERRALSLPRQLSGGEQQRVAVARALVGRPALLLADEPTGNLDAATAAGILDLFDELHDDGESIMVVTHDPSTSARAARTITMRDGVAHVASGGR